MHMRTFLTAAAATGLIVASSAGPAQAADITPIPIPGSYVSITPIPIPYVGVGSLGGVKLPPGFRIPGSGGVGPVSG